MDFRGDERAQPVVIGSLLIFAILILAFSGYQAFVVPNQNADVEFSHSQDVQSQMQETRSTVIRSASVGTHQSTSVQLGTTYPSRLIALNPPPATGTLQTSDPLTITIRNATVDGETGDYWNGSTRTFETRPISYRSEYNVFDGSPTTRLEHSVLYNEFEDGTFIAKSGQQVVLGRQLSLVLVDGTYQRSGAETVPFDVAPASTSPNRVPLQAGDQPIEIELETTIPESIWVAELLERQIVGANGSESSCSEVGMTDAPNESRYVVDCEYEGTTDPATITLTLKEGATYELLSSKVGVGARVTEPNEGYITDIEGNGSTIPAGGEQLLVAEARDGFDNPVSGVEVCAEVSDGSINFRSNTSDSAGRVSLFYEAPDPISDRTVTETVTVGYDCSGGSPDVNSTTTFVDFEVTVNNPSGGAGPPGS